MSYSDQAYNAGKEGRDWYSVQQQYGDSYSTRNAFESGKTARLYSGNNPGGQAFGEGLGMIMIVIVAFYMLSVIYSPFIAIAFMLLLPLWPSYSSDYFGSEYIIYAVIFIIVVYLQSCLFEYLRSRMVEARAKNYNWKRYYLPIFTIRILLPGMAVYLFITSNGGSRTWEMLRLDYMAFLGAMVVVCLLLWKVKILQADSRLYFTGWAFSKGEKSMSAKPYLEPKAGFSYSKTKQLYIFYGFWAVLTLVTGAFILSILMLVFPGSIYYRKLPALVLCSICFSLAGYLSRMILDRNSLVFLKHDFRTKLNISARQFIVMPLLTCMLIFPVMAALRLSTSQIMLLFATLLAAQIVWRIKKYEKRELKTG